MSTLSLRLLICLTGMMLVGCEPSSTQQAAPPPPPKVAVANPLIEPIVEWDEFTARFEAIDKVDVRSRVSGYLQSVHFSEGQLVKKGDLLVIVDPRPYEAILTASVAGLAQANAHVGESQALLQQAYATQNQTQAELNLRKRQIDRAKTLLQKNSVSQGEVDVLESEYLKAVADHEASKAKIQASSAGVATSEAALQSAKAEVESAQLNLSYCQIRSPLTGRISQKNVTQGNLISGGSETSTLITTIVSVDPIHCTFYVDQQIYLKYVRLNNDGTRISSRDVKNPVYLGLIDEKGFPHKGHVDFVDNRFDPKTGTILGRAILSNPDGTLSPGLFAKLRLPGSGRYDATLVPDACIVSDQSDKLVYAVGADNKIVRKIVTLGPIAKGLRVIRKGLEPTDRVVLRGIQRLAPGMDVVPVMEKIETNIQDELPDNYAPVPKEEWLTRPPDETPKGMESNQKNQFQPTSARIIEDPAQLVHKIEE